MKWEVAIHRWYFCDTKEDIQKHAEEISGLLNQGFIFMTQTSVNYQSQSGRETFDREIILTTFKREKK